MSDSFDRVEALHEYLEPEAVQAYKAIARRNPIDDVSDRILAKLLDVGLVRPTPELPWLYSAVDPKIALERWRRDLYQRARNMMDASEEVERLLPRLNDAFHASAPSVIPGGIEYVADRDMVNARIEALFQNCTSELRTAQPSGARKAEDLKMSYRRDIERLQKGVAMKTLYLDSVRADATTAEWAQRVSIHGAQIRTLARPFERMVLIDRSVGIISDVTTSDAGRAVIVHDPKLVAWLISHFDAEWELAEPWYGTDRPDADPVLTPEQDAILEGLAQGLAPAAIGRELPRRLGGRTVEARKKELKELAGVETDFELAVWWCAIVERRRKRLQ